MRTSISLDDRLFEQVKERAREERSSVSAWIARVVDDALKARPAAPVRPFRLVTVRGEGARPGVDLDRPRELAVAEDEARYRRLGGD